MSDPITATSIIRSLTPALALSGRAPDEVLIAAWVYVLVDGLTDRGIRPITQEEFDRAVRRHMLESSYPIQPSHVWDLVRTDRVTQVGMRLEGEFLDPAVAAARVMDRARLRVIGQ